MKTFVHNYKGFGNCDSKCRVYLKKVTNPRYGDTTFVCFEDMGVGTSVTNMSEHLATQIVEEFDLDPQKTRFFESYTYYTPQSLDEIEYAWDGNKASHPQWSRPEIDLRHVFGFES